MYEIALSVAACQRSGTDPVIAWIVSDEGFDSRERGEALAITPGGGRIGGLLGGALNDQIAALVAEGTTRRLVEVSVDEVGALIAGLPSTGSARCLVVPAADFPDGFWDGLWEGRALCVVAKLDGDRVVDLSVHDDQQVAGLGEEVARLFSSGMTDSLVEPGRVTTVLWPVPRLAVVGGGGPIGEALEKVGRAMGWQVYRFRGADDAGPLLMGFGALDMVLVAGHDVEASSTSLAAALNGHAGYVGALGSQEMNEARQDWLTMRDVPGRERVYGPAGLDIGARRPTEVAISIIAEALAVRSGAPGRSLRDGRDVSPAT